MDGKYIETLKGYGLPANIDSWKDLLLIPELHARVTLLNDKNEVVAKLGEDVERVTKKVKGVRNDSKNGFQENSFTHMMPVSTRMVIFSLQNGCRLAEYPDYDV